ncbi:MAG TPA: CHAT domain-containing tetratricopeptide repeat protein [Blastocatellia bacterium]|nr:CHAT domain-containing tetratricopeptide repeat protein [Blastocatellia bacterium]
MKVEKMAAVLAAADDDSRASLFRQYPSLNNVDLAHSLKSRFDEVKTTDPSLARGALSALKSLAELTDDPGILAISVWTEALEALQIEGKAEFAIGRLDQASEQFAKCGQPLLAAATQINKLQALAMLGRYDEALECGQCSRQAFLDGGEVKRAGQVEQNLGNIYFRRDRYQEAEQYYRAARARFLAEDDTEHLLEVDVCLATSLIYQHRFRDGSSLYRDALARAENAGKKLHVAVIECDLGCLAMFQGHYDQALDYLERSRRRYAELGMLHESAIAEQELAEAYLELNLAPEAGEMFDRAIRTFESLGLRAEQARALSGRGRALLLEGKLTEASGALKEARNLYLAEGNSIGEATVMLSEAQIHHAEGRLDAAAAAASKAEAPLADAGRWDLSLLARWLRADAARAQGDQRSAAELLTSAVADADARGLPQLAGRCYASLGMLSASQGDTTGAETSLNKAVDLIEHLRATLPTDELRTAFVADKQTPYSALVRLCLADRDRNRIDDALGYVERARSRALADMMSGAVQFRHAPRDQFEANLLAKLEELGEELNWFYSQISRQLDGTGVETAAAREALQRAARERESAMTEISRQLQQRGGPALSTVEPVDIGRLQHNLGPDTALVEYFSLDGELLAFIVTNESVDLVRSLGKEDEVHTVLGRLRFQMNSLRFGAGRLRDHIDQLAGRTRHHLAQLYDLVFAKVDERLRNRRVVIVPHRDLHYVPFHALFDGRSFVIERREVCYCPSATVLSHCIEQIRRPPRKALLLGMPDPRAPRVRDEVVALGSLFPETIQFLSDAATLANLKGAAGDADIIHLACHGSFRADNPLFSSLRLADGWLTVRDSYQLRLNCSLVTLSACETGMSAVAPGNELIGLARGFFSAGSPSLLVTLWTVDDEQTSLLMQKFYASLMAGRGPAAALRDAQIELIRENQHPFFWSPFILLGRW